MTMIVFFFFLFFLFFLVRGLAQRDFGNSLSHPYSPVCIIDAHLNMQNIIWNHCLSNLPWPSSDSSNTIDYEDCEVTFIIIGKENGNWLAVKACRMPRSPLFLFFKGNNNNSKKESHCYDYTILIGYIFDVRSSNRKRKNRVLRDVSGEAKQTRQFSFLFRLSLGFTGVVWMIYSFQDGRSAS